jgi:hypothetical protein
VATPSNAGRQHAHSAFTAFIDADDLGVPPKMERRLALFQSADARIGLVRCWHSRIDETGRIAVRQCNPLHEGTVVEPITSSNFIGNGSSVVIRRDALVAAWDGRWTSGTRARPCRCWSCTCCAAARFACRGGRSQRQ